MTTSCISLGGSSRHPPCPKTSGSSSSARRLGAPMGPAPVPSCPWLSRCCSDRTGGLPAPSPASRASISGGVKLIHLPSTGSKAATMRAVALGLALPSRPSWRSGCWPPARRLMAWAPAGVGALHGKASPLARRFPHAPHRVHMIRGRSASALTSEWPLAAYAPAPSAIVAPLQLWRSRYAGTLARVT